MNRAIQNSVQKGRRWFRVAALTLTIAGPVVNTFLQWLRRRAQSLSERSDDLQDSANAAQAAALNRFNEFALASRQRAAEQARQLQEQAKQLRSQTRHLRKALRKEAKRRRKLDKLVKQLRETGIDWSQELLRRGEDLTGGLVVQGGRISQDLIERGGKVTRDLSERGGQVRHTLVSRGGQLTHDLRKRSSEVTQDLAERGEQLLQPARQRNSAFWTIFGFSLGLVGAAVVTYLFVRRRMIQQEAEQSQSIELPQDQELYVVGKSGPVGEILHIDNDGADVVILQAAATEVDSQVGVPAGTAFVGVASTKHYYPVDSSFDYLSLSDDKAQDLVYFASEEEAQAQGFTAAG